MVLAIRETPFVLLSIVPFQFAETTQLVVLPLPLVLSGVMPKVKALTMNFVGVEFPSVEAAVAEVELTVALLLVGSPPSLIPFPIYPLQNTFPLPLVILPFSLIF